MKFYGALPETCEVNGRVYRINTDFRLWVRVDIWARGECDTAALVDLMTEAFGDFLTEDAEGLVKVFTLFYLCKSEPSEATRTGKGKEVEHEYVYGFEEDSDRILAAFQREYGIDLTSADMHWWRFQALFSELMYSDSFTDIVRYRAVPLDKVPKERKQEYIDKKNLYRIVAGPDTLEERNAAWIAALKNN